MGAISVSGTWAALVGASILCDVAATAYLKWAGDRFTDNFFWANVVSVAFFAPAIVTFGYALRSDQGYLVTTLVWLVGLTLANTLAGVLLFGDPFGAARAAGLVAACLAFVLLTA